MADSQLPQITQSDLTGPGNGDLLRLNKNFGYLGGQVSKLSSQLAALQAQVNALGTAAAASPPLLTNYVRTAADFNKTASTVLANITGLTIIVATGAKYAFEAILHLSADATGGSQWAIGGTATFTSMRYEVILFDNVHTNTFYPSTNTTTSGSAQTNVTGGIYWFRGVAVVNTGGTMTIQFAQAVSHLTSTVLAGSEFRAFQVL